MFVGVYVHNIHNTFCLIYACYLAAEHIQNALKLPFTLGLKVLGQNPDWHVQTAEMDNLLTLKLHMTSSPAPSATEALIVNSNSISPHKRLASCFTTEVASQAA